MHDPWFQAFSIVPPTMCGVRLLPYSVAHDYLLLHLGNSYIVDGVDSTNEADLFEVVTVCSRTWEQNQLFWTGRDHKNWLARLMQWTNHWHKKIDFTVADASLKTYINDYRAVPEHHASRVVPKTDHGFHEIAAPLHWHLVRVLRDVYHMTRSEAWNCAFAEAKCSFDVWSESQGDDTLESITDMRINELCREATAFCELGDIETMEAKYAEVEVICNARIKAHAGEN